MCVSNRIESAASVMKIFNFKMATDVFSQLVCLGFSGDGNTFHGDACGKVWLPSTLDCTFEKFYIYRDRQFVPYSKKTRRKLLVPIDCRKVKFMLWDWPPLVLSAQGSLDTVQFRYEIIDSVKVFAPDGVGRVTGFFFLFLLQVTVHPRGFG